MDTADCVVFGDARPGIASARRAGAGKIVGVASVLKKDTLWELGASMTIDDYNDPGLKGIIRERDQ